MLPAKERRGSPTGGGSFYIFKSASAEQQKAAVKFMQWMTAPERAAEWSIKTGYVAVSPAAYKTAAMEKYATDFPAATVARDQLDHAVPELSVHENGRIYKFVNDAVQSAVTGAQKPQEALAAAQQQADRVLKEFEFFLDVGPERDPARFDHRRCEPLHRFAKLVSDRRELGRRVGSPKQLLCCP